LNSITEFSDHYARARSQDHRLASAWQGDNADMKAFAFDELSKLAA
jgi:hypothetical protein